MHMNTRHQHYIIKVALDICKDCAMAKIKHKLIFKVVEDQNLNPGKRVYIDICSQKKPSSGGSSNWILLQDSYTMKNGPSSPIQNNN